MGNQEQGPRPSPQESHKEPQQSGSKLAAIAESLGFEESDRMVALRGRLVSDLKLELEPKTLEQVSPGIRQLQEEYHTESQRLINGIAAPPLYMRAALGLIVAEADIAQRGGWSRTCLYHLDNGLTTARNLEDIGLDLGMVTSELELEQFREKYRTELYDVFDGIEVSQPDEAFAPDPYTLGYADWTFAELDPAQRQACKEVLYEVMEVNAQEGVVSAYELPRDDMPPTKVTVFETSKGEQGIFLHELLYDDGVTEWRLGPNERLDE